MLGELINFNKLQMIYRSVTDTLHAQHNQKMQEIPFQEEINQFLSRLSLLGLTEKEIYERSLQIEPRNATKADIK
jgi:hypothetical protein